MDKLVGVTEKIKAHLASIPLSVRQLAIHIDKDQAHLDKVLKGRRALTDETLAAINEHLGTDFKKNEK